jgi:ketosteroid isomerase-like protein
VPNPPEDAVLAANRSFYTAFNDRDAQAMEHLWALEHRASCIHPGWAPLFGRQTIIASWRAIFGSPEPPKVDITDAHAVVMGGAAFVTCVEHLAEATIAATNVFVQEHGEWRLVHHQGGPMPPARPSRRPSSKTMN